MLRARRYKALQEEYPDLEDTPTARRAFRTLHKFSPDMASDPMAAHGFVNRVMNYNELTTPEQISTLVGVQRGMPQSPQMLDQAAQGFGRDLSQRMMAAPEEARREHKHQFEYGIRGTAAKEEKRRAAKEKRDITESGRKGEQHEREGEKFEHQKRMDKYRRGVDRVKDRLDRDRFGHQQGVDQARISQTEDQMAATARDNRRQRAEGKVKARLEQKKYEQSQQGHALKGVDTSRQLFDTLEKVRTRAGNLHAQMDEHLEAAVGQHQPGDPMHALAMSDLHQHRNNRDQWLNTAEEAALGDARKRFQQVKFASQLDEMRASRTRSSAKAAFAERFKR
jgi:hypothetical protein